MPAKSPEDVRTPVMCSKCGLNPRPNSESSNPWCRQCWRDYIRANRTKELERSRAAGRAEGLKLMRDAIVARFSKWPTAYFSGAEVVSQVTTLPAPTGRT